MINQGTFREDLYYRLNGITLELPALAERADKERLIRHMIATETRDGRPIAVEVDAFQQLLRYPWPGNIRELRNVIRTALAICDGGLVTLADLPREIRSPEPIMLAAHNAQRLDHSDQRPDPLSDHTAERHGGAAASKLLAGEPTGVNPLEAAERAALIHAIEKNRWNMSNTAAQLGMSRNTLYRKIKRHRIPLGND
jgi:transcriptional regulator of acetoin/glycerol metabolism